MTALSLPSLQIMTSSTWPQTWITFTQPQFRPDLRSYGLSTARDANKTQYRNYRGDLFWRYTYVRRRRPCARHSAFLGLCAVHAMYPLNAERAGDVPRIKQFAVVHAGIWLYACDVKTSVDVT